MFDPLQDPRAIDLLSAAPDDVARLATSFRTAAGESQMTGAGLSAARQDATWTGPAADGFRRSIGRLPAELGRAQAGYAAVAEALAAYEPELSRIQSAFARTIAELTDVQAQRELARIRAHEAVGGYPAPAEVGYRDELERLCARARAQLEEFSQLRSACRAAIASARHSAPAAPRPARHAAAYTPATQAEVRIEAMISRADTLLGTPYVYGGGHAGWTAAGGLDCSGFVSAVLRSGGYLSAPVTTDGLAAQPHIAAGPGRWVTIYDRTNAGANEHVIIDLNGRFYEAGGGGLGGAPMVHQFSPSSDYLASFNTILHPVGL